jgi:hypothetical protein
MRLSPPELSHVVPLSREISGGQAGKANLQRTYAMRLYVRRPFFLSGPGERLAIGCQVGRLPEAPSPSLNKFVTQWGEDPIERPKLDVTLRAPRASDFRIPDGLGDVHLDANLYPPGSLEGASPVIYRDSVMRADPKDDPSNLALSAVSFAVRWDEQTKLWYCDVQIGDSFVGWCGMALYRHQPHAHEMVQFSQTPAWVYGAVLHGEPVAWLKQNGKLRVTVGPVFDPYTDFVLDGSKFQHGVGEDLRRARTRVVALTKYVANGQVFFEGLVPSDAAEWTLVKTRFGGSIASINLTAG